MSGTVANLNTPQTEFDPRGLGHHIPTSSFTISQPQQGFLKTHINKRSSHPNSLKHRFKRHMLSDLQTTKWFRGKTKRENLSMDKINPKLIMKRMKKSQNVLMEQKQLWITQKLLRK